MLIRTSLIQAKLTNISIDSRDEKLSENSILEYSQGLLCLANVILDDSFFFIFCKNPNFRQKIGNIRVHFMVTLGHQPYIWLYKQEIFLSQGKIKPNAFFSYFYVFTYKFHKKQYHNALDNKYCATFYVGKGKGDAKINDAVLVKSTKPILNFFLTRQCSLTHMHGISQTNDLVNFGNLTKIS